jgi:hypothetical protein
MACLIGSTLVSGCLQDSTQTAPHAPTNQVLYETFARVKPTQLAAGMQSAVVPPPPPQPIVTASQPKPAAPQLPVQQIAVTAPPISAKSLPLPTVVAATPARCSSQPPLLPAGPVLQPPQLTAAPAMVALSAPYPLPGKPASTLAAPAPLQLASFEEPRPCKPVLPRTDVVTPAKPSAEVPAIASFGHASDYSWISGRVTRWGDQWLLRYATVTEVDLYGGSLPLVGGEHLAKLLEGGNYKLRGRLVEHDLKEGGPAFHIEAVQ